MNAWRRLGLAGIASAFAWLWAAAFLSREWRANEQYHYAWGVLPLALWATLRRPGGAGKSQLFSAMLAASLALSAFFIGEALRWHDPLWRLTGALLLGAAVFFTAALLLACGGWPALRARAFPLGFAFTALPWPVPLELFATRHLLHLVTGGVVATANVLGVAALQRMNVIETRGGLVGLEAACSGVQSLQASLMAALFVGEFFPLPPLRRLAVLGSGVLVAIAANFLRVLAFTLLTAARGSEAAAAWHDSIGAAATVLTFVLLYSTARMLATDAPLPAWSSGSFEPVPPALHAAGALLLLEPLAWAVWFAQTAEPAGPRTARWRLQPERLPSGWRAEAIAPGPREAALLRYTERAGWRITDPHGAVVTLIHLWWEPGASQPGAAFTHTPALCMPWAGWTPRGPVVPVMLRAGSREMPAVAARFTLEGVELGALQVLASGGELLPPESDPTRLGARLSRLAQLWRAPRAQVDEELLIYLSPGAEPTPWIAAEQALGTLLAPAR